MTNSRRKGKDGELELARILRGHGYDSRRGQQFKGGGDSPDVIGLPGIHIEVKRVERLNVHDAMDQSERDAAATEVPAVFHRKDRKPWLVTLRLEDFLDLYRRSSYVAKDTDAEIDI